MVQLTDADVAALRAVVPVEASNDREEYFAMVNSIINAAAASGRSVADEVYSGRYYGLQNDSRAAQENRSNPALLAQVDDAIGRVQRGEPDPTRGATYFEGNYYLDQGKNPTWLADMQPGGARIGGTTFFVPRGAETAGSAAPVGKATSAIPSWMYATGSGTDGAPRLQDRTIAGYIASRGTPVNVREGIVDRTSTQGMTAQAQAILEGARRGAEQAGLSQIIITAAKGGGHKSHSAGTEWDIKGRNADGSLWTNAQRVAVAEGARQAGADRFGVYRMDSGLGAGTLHIGNSGPGRPAAVWGANGLTGGAASRAFTNPAERAFLAAVTGKQPLDIAALGLSGRAAAPNLLPARDPTLSFAPTRYDAAATPAAQAATAMATGRGIAAPQGNGSRYGGFDAKAALEEGTPKDRWGVADFTRNYADAPRPAYATPVGSLPFSARDFGFSRPPGGMDSAGRVTGYANNAFVVPTQSISPESVRGLPQIGTAAPRASAMQPPAAQPARWDDPRNLSAMAAMYGARPAQLGAPILDARAFRPSTNSAPVKNVRPSYNPPRAAAPAPQRAAPRAAAPARTGGNALTRAVSGVGRAVSAVTSGQAAQAALGVLSGYGGGSVPAGANPSMFAGTGYSWSNPGAYAGGNPYEYAFAATPFR